MLTENIANSLASIRQRNCTAVASQLNGQGNEGPRSILDTKENVIAGNIKFPVSYNLVSTTIIVPLLCR